MLITGEEMKSISDLEELSKRKLDHFQFPPAYYYVSKKEFSKILKKAIRDNGLPFFTDYGLTIVKWKKGKKKRKALNTQHA
jgi:hypothetical protein